MGATTIADGCLNTAERPSQELPDCVLVLEEQLIETVPDVAEVGCQARLHVGFHNIRIAADLERSRPLRSRHGGGQTPAASMRSKQRPV